MNHLMHCERWIVKGRVQKVGFRYFSMRSAHKHGIRGAARNLPSGEVELIVSGSPGAIDLFYRDILKGPPMASVSVIQRKDIDMIDCNLALFDIIFQGGADDD